MRSAPRNIRFCLHLRYNSTVSYWRDVIDVKNASVNAIVHTAGLHPGTGHGPLKDLAIAVKDNICTASMPTTCSSAMLKDFTSPFNATVVDLLQDAGAQIIGKTNCDEFGMGSLNTHSVYGPVVNPYSTPSDSAPWVERERRSAGGSSGGSAAAVAEGMCDAALATDTGGSTRLPASYCGVVGLKPSYGLISRWGVVSFADSLDCVGIMANDVATTKRVFNVASTYDPKDPTAATLETRHKSQLTPMPLVEKNLQGLRIGIPQEYFPAELDRSIIRSFRLIVSALKDNGASIIPVSLPSTSYALSAYYVIASAEVSSNLARYDGIQYGLRVDTPHGADKTKTSNIYAHTRSQGFGREVQKRILLGTYALTADAFDNYFLQAQRVRKLVREDFDHVFRAPNVLMNHSSNFTSSSQTSNSNIDVLLHPSAIRTAPLLPLSSPDSSSILSSSSGLDAYFQDVLTVPASLAGLPALSVPVCSGVDGWPVGVSVVGQWGCDDLVLRVGEIVEQL
ncbi:hypothetical protein PILCRDRAFT_174051 [Piloderma croceum F 1598]|uniref:Glutamyl-tRNA(Gln) amidotransferase subunit A, mitochondrial n=1 Tax=Piloderma croceum (strain F 1598) TaxID=765440 RepID=A0A0C3GEQ3_PILCF|nr:hypothetical protein PILCRDRAFT_174051 [Piloderma croceum F 1598]